MKKVLFVVGLVLLLLAWSATAVARPSGSAAPEQTLLAGPAAVTLLFDDFESGQIWDAGSSGWSIVTPDASYSPLPSSTHCAHASSQYGVAAPMMIYGPFDLGSATTASLSFQLWYDAPTLTFPPGSTATCGAFLIGYSTDGSSFTFPTQWSGSTDQAWQPEQIDLSSWYDQVSQSTISLLGDHRVWLALSDSVSSAFASSTEGAYVDDLSVAATIPDSIAPVTTVSGCDANWHRKPVTLHFSATDNAGGAGVDYTEYSTDGGNSWTQGDSLTVQAPANHAGDGLHTIYYKSVDKAQPANWESAKSCQVKIDTTGPVCVTKNLTVTHGTTCRFYFKVHDARSSKVSRVLTVETRSGVVKKRWTWGYGANSASWRSMLWRCTLAKGTYRILVSGKDLAGNAQSVVGKGSLRVR